MTAASLTWLGHASFRSRLANGSDLRRPVVRQPAAPQNEKDPERRDDRRHARHSDHVGSVVAITEKLGSIPIVGMVELKSWLQGQGAQTDGVPGPNKGGTVEVEGVKFTLTNAFHSSAADDGTYLGEAAGIVVELEDGKKIYFAGDTCVFGDMELIARIYASGRRRAADRRALHDGSREARGSLRAPRREARRPSHYGTFPLLAGTPDQLKELAKGVEVHAIDPGESVEAVRERWFERRDGVSRRSPSRASSTSARHWCSTTCPMNAGCRKRTQPGSRSSCEPLRRRRSRLRLRIRRSPRRWYPPSAAIYSTWTCAS
jgi:L-ascorbate metabolism protein UlaG (beta-lactamase superfamily)